MQNLRYLSTKEHNYIQYTIQYIILIIYNILNVRLFYQSHVISLLELFPIYCQDLLSENITFCTGLSK